MWSDLIHTLYRAVENQVIHLWALPLVPTQHRWARNFPLQQTAKQLWHRHHICIYNLCIIRSTNMLMLFTKMILQLLGIAGCVFSFHYQISKTDQQMMPTRLVPTPIAFGLGTIDPVRVAHLMDHMFSRCKLPVNCEKGSLLQSSNNAVLLLYIYILIMS